MLSVRPRVAELAFHLLGRSLHPELYAIHKTRRIQRSGYEAKLDITNSGHVITWCGAGQILTEVAASARQPLPARRQLLSHRIMGQRREQHECRGGATYRTEFQLESVAPELFWNFQEQLFGGPAPEGLAHRFDASGRLALGAFSYIHVDTRASSMMVQAIHTFPDDYAIVKVESVFTLPKKPFGS
ncbi:DUF2617 family protein [Candidatus Laterigemmans baculatus]|uniref:DUF2617 family protein n=1 Tax=Candidatus Laterigemmans baculatus TaxID=2770505 RepID=UPI0013DAD0F6|nr:DUF2617 family protein [Candidatus Laterigemmans baculatus]